MESGGKIRILIVDDVREGREGLARLLDFESDMEVIGYATTGSEAIERAKELRPDVILMDINMPDMDGITATEKITQVVPTSVVMISVQSDKDYMRQAMRAGAKDFLPKPPSADELYATVRNAYENKPIAAKTGPLSGLPMLETDRQPISSRVVVVYSPQGGAGATTLSVNLASGLMTDRQRAVLVDTNLQFGDVAVHLAMRNERNLIDLAKTADDLDTDLIENVLATHGTGLRVLPAPQRPQDSQTIQPDSILKVVDTLADQFGYVVVDTAPHLDDVSLGLILRCDLLVLVGIPTLPCVRNLRVTLDLLQQFEEFDTGKIVFTMNKVPADRKSGALDLEAISNALKLQIQATIPSSEKPMLQALNRGVPVIVNARQSPGKEIMALVQNIQSVLASVAMEVAGGNQEEQRGRLGGLFSS